MYEHKNTQLLVEKVSKKTSFQVRTGPVKRTETRRGTRKIKNTTLIRNDGTLFFGLQLKALASLVHLVMCKVN